MNAATGRCRPREMPDTGGELGLAPLFHLRGFEGSVCEYVERLYWQYRAMVDHAGIRIWGKPLAVSDTVAADGRDRLFWHLITAGSSEHTEETRRLNLKRCAHLPWVWDILDCLAHDDPRVCWWREGWHIMVAPVDFSMIVVLQERPGAFRLKTAFPTTKRKQTKRSFNRAGVAWETGQCWRQFVDEKHPKWRSGVPGHLPPARQLVTRGSRV